MPPTPADNPGDPNGVQFEGEIAEARALPTLWPSAWDGWPAQWATPDWSSTLGVSQLIDVAWAAIDLNASVLSSMPLYRLKNGEVLPPLSWMVNPDPDVYTSWPEFAKQLFWDFQCTGEAFVLPMAHGADGYPLRFRVVPPWLVNVELRGGRRQYFLGGVAGQDVTADILHIRYMSNTADAHGHGPLESAGARMTAAGLLQRYAHRLAQTGGTPHYWIGVDRRLNASEAQDLLAQWVKSRTDNAGHPALLSGAASLNQLQSMNAKDMALLELTQFNESRIATLLGVPPFLVGLPSGSEQSLTYSNVSQLFSFHERASLRPKATAVMTALSAWLLPRGQSVEINRDEYSRPDFKERAEAWKILAEIGAVSIDEIRAAERFNGPAPAGAVLTGAEMTGAATTSESGPVPAQQGDQNAVSNS